MLTSIAMANSSVPLSLLKADDIMRTVDAAVDSIAQDEADLGAIMSLRRFVQKKTEEGVIVVEPENLQPLIDKLEGIRGGGLSSKDDDQDHLRAALSMEIRNLIARLNGQKMLASQAAVPLNAKGDEGIADADSVDPQVVFDRMVAALQAAVVEKKAKNPDLPREELAKESIQLLEQQIKDLLKGEEDAADSGGDDVGGRREPQPHPLAEVVQAAKANAKKAPEEPGARPTKAPTTSRAKDSAEPADTTRGPVLMQAAPEVPAPSTRPASGPAPAPTQMPASRPAPAPSPAATTASGMKLPEKPKPPRKVRAAEPVKAPRKVRGMGDRGGDSASSDWSSRGGHRHGSRRSQMRMIQNGRGGSETSSSESEESSSEESLEQRVTYHRHHHDRRLVKRKPYVMPPPVPQPGSRYRPLDPLAPGQDHPDVLLDIPNVSVEEISLDVRNIRAHVALEAKIANLVQLSVGVDASIDDVNLSIRGVRANALLIVRLHNVRKIVDKVLSSIVKNPMLINRLLDTADRAVGTVGGVLHTVVQPGGVLTQAVDSLGRTVVQTVDKAGNIVEHITSGPGGKKGHEEDRREIEA
jgi:hypothetical protein